MDPTSFVDACAHEDSFPLLCFRVREREGGDETKHICFDWVGMESKGRQERKGLRRKESRKGAR